MSVNYEGQEGTERDVGLLDIGMIVITRWRGIETLKEVRMREPGMGNPETGEKGQS